MFKLLFHMKCFILFFVEKYKERCLLHNAFFGLLILIVPPATKSKVLLSVSSEPVSWKALYFCLLNLGYQNYFVNSTFYEIVN